MPSAWVFIQLEKNSFQRPQTRTMKMENGISPRINTIWNASPSPLSIFNAETRITDVD